MFQHSKTLKNKGKVDCLYYVMRVFSKFNNSTEYQCSFFCQVPSTFFNGLLHFLLLNGFQVGYRVEFNGFLFKAILESVDH